jgi:hypothetical protein
VDDLKLTALKKSGCEKIENAPDTTQRADWGDYLLET